MTTPPSPIDNGSDPLQAIRDDLQRRESETSKQADHVARRQQLGKRFASSFNELIPFACSSLARDDRSRSETFFVDLARRLLAFNETLREADQEYPRYRIVERLGQAARAGVPALDTAASLLLTAPSAPVEGLARDLERFQGTHPHKVWPMWLTYILDQLMNSHRPPTKDNVPPDTTRDEWRKAELAFGCILFSEEAFRVMQQDVDKAACRIDDALKCGGHPELKRPAGRVRDLIARFDPRALHWYASEPIPLLLLQPPPAIVTITEPESTRRQLDEVWTAASVLQIALDKWAAWFIELREKKDADPCIALNCSEMAQRAVKVLLTHRPNVEPFDRTDEDSLLSMLPPLPGSWGTGIADGPDDESESMASTPVVRWQEDREFLDRYYYSPERLHDKAIKLRGATAQLIELLKFFPLTALAPPRTPVKCKNAARPEREMEAPCDILDSLLSQAESRRRQDDEARRLAEENAGRLRDHADLREQLAEAFNCAVAFPREENQQGRKPGQDGFRRWAERFLALGSIMRECDNSIESLRLLERLRAVSRKTAPAAMKYACALLLAAAEGNEALLASALEKANGDGELRRFVLWLPFILDNLWYPFPREDGVTPVALSPDGTSQEENRQAEEAFGWRQLSLYGDPPAAATRPTPPDPQAIHRREIERINRLHRVAVICADAVIRLDALRFFADGDQHARAVLVELQEAGAEMPELPMNDDPFSGDDLVVAAGVTTTSWHSAAFALARRTWNAAHLTELAPGNATRHHDAKGTPFTRVTQEIVRHAPTEVEWTFEVWKQISEQLAKCPAPDQEKLQAALTLERTRAARRLETRFGGRFSDNQTASVQSAEVIPATVSSPRLDVETKASSTQRAGETQTPAPEIDLESHAIALLYQHQDWSVQKIADHLKVDRKTPYKWEKFRKAAELAGRLKPRGPKDRTPRRGHKTPDGQVEAYADEDEDE